MDYNNSKTTTYRGGLFWREFLCEGVVVHLLSVHSVSEFHSDSESQRSIFLSRKQQRFNRRRDFSRCQLDYLISAI